MSLDRQIVETLSEVSTATLTTVLLKLGLRNTWMRGPQPLGGGRPRVVGRAFTLRFIPAREDLATPESWGAAKSTRAAVEAMSEGCVAVVDAMGLTNAGIFGDILCMRMQKRGIAALVTDGVIRDRAGVLSTALPVWSDGVAAPPSIAALTFINWQEPIGCGGVAVFPDDVIVADEDGVVAIPNVFLDRVVNVAAEQEQLEAWIMDEVRGGALLPGLYPPNEENAARYRSRLAAKKR